MEKGRQLKILMLEDNADDAGLIERILRKEQLDFIAHRVDSREDFDKSIKHFGPDVILSDHGMPDFNSIEALKICMKERLLAPFILVTGTVSEEFAATCLKLGADDYILKSNLSRLPSAIHRALKQRKVEHLKREARRALRNQNRALLKSNEELLKVNHELDNFVYSVSHNLRGPLSSVLGLIRLTKLGVSPTELAKIHDMIYNSVLRLDETLQEIIDYSKNARNGIDLENVDLKNFITATVEALQSNQPERLTNWIIEVNQDEAIKCDKTRIGIILKNVLSNAIQFRDSSREALVSVSVVVTPANVTITIKDNGIGIKNEVLPRVFEMFFRGTETSTGAGLGLYIVKETVKRLKGTIELTSEFGKGTNVQILIPNMINPSEREVD